MLKPPAKRLFFALWPDEWVREALLQQQHRLDLAAGRAVHKSDLHLTLQYLGLVNPDQLECITAAAHQVQASSFELKLAGVHYWKRPRVVWVGTVGIPVGLTDLVSQLGYYLAQCGFPPEARTYCPHVTLQRNVRLQPEQIPHAPVGWEVRDFVLVQSHTDGRLPRYEVINRFSLVLSKKILENK